MSESTANTEALQTLYAARIAARLTEHARLLGEAALRAARAARRDPARAWRDARLLWPLFTKG